MQADIAVRTFEDRVVEATPGGDTLTTCLQCGTCSGSCPAAADMDYLPRQLIAMIRAGMEDEVLDSHTPWMCVSCYHCMERCPMDVPVTELMYTLKQMAIQRGRFRWGEHLDFSKTFIGLVKQFGRSFELGLASRYHLAHHPLKMAQQGGLGFEMVRRGRLNIVPGRIRDVSQLRAILSEAERLAESEEKI